MTVDEHWRYLTIGLKASACAVVLAAAARFPVAANAAAAVLATGGLFFMVTAYLAPTSK
jgi:hypothetical protein